MGNEQKKDWTAEQLFWKNELEGDKFRAEALREAIEGILKLRLEPYNNEVGTFIKLFEEYQDAVQDVGVDLGHIDAYDVVLREEKKEAEEES